MKMTFNEWLNLPNVQAQQIDIDALHETTTFRVTKLIKTGRREEVLKILSKYGVLRPSNLLDDKLSYKLFAAELQAKVWCKYYPPAPATNK
jgi:hypothetical protein